MLTIRYMNKNETYNFIGNKESSLSSLVSVGSTADILLDSVGICKIIFACLFSVHNITSLLRHEQEYL